MKDKKLNKTTKQLFALAFTLVLLIGGSYAWLTLQVKGEKTNVLKAGTLSLVLDDATSNGIKLEKAVPISDEKGKTGTEYTFTLQNKGSKTASYTIYLDDVALTDDETKMDDSKVKYQLTKNGDEAVALLNTLTDKVLDSGDIDSNTTNTYSLRVWIDSAAGNEVMGTILSKELRVEATQAGAKNSSTTSKYYAFGTPTSESPTNFQDVMTSSKSKTFVQLEDEQLSVCIYKNSALECFKNNSAENEKVHIKSVFGEDNCTTSNDEVNCVTDEFNCSVNSTGRVECYDVVPNLYCAIYPDGLVSCR